MPWGLGVVVVAVTGRCIDVDSAIAAPVPFESRRSDVLPGGAQPVVYLILDHSCQLSGIQKSCGELRELDAVVFENELGFELLLLPCDGCQHEQIRDFD